MWLGRSCSISNSELVVDLWLVYPNYVRPNVRKYIDRNIERAEQLVINTALSIGSY